MLNKLSKLIFFATILFFVVSLYLIFIWSPIENQMGIVQKIFYYHVSTAWIAFLAFFIVFIFSILYLVTRKKAYYVIAGVSAEVGVLFTTIVIITGMIWGRSAWNTWWSWEPRLTTTLILWFSYLAYLLIRNLEGNEEKKTILASVFGIFSFVNVPIVYMSIRWWNSKLHPVLFGPGKTQSNAGLEPEMGFTLAISVITITLLYLLLLKKGVNLAISKNNLEKIKADYQEKSL